MRAYLRSPAIAICLFLAASLPVRAQPVPPLPAALTLQGHLTHPRGLSLLELQALPTVTVEDSHIGPNGVRTTQYTGVLLWTLLDAAAPPIDQGGPRSHLQHTIRATGRDGYTLALAIAEIDPDFEGKQVLVAYAQEGRAMPTLKLVVPADAKARRDVRDLVSIDLN